MKKALVLTMIVATLILSSGCNLLKKVPDNTAPGTTAVSPEAKVENPSDHVFDINLDTLKEVLTGKILGDDKQNWTLKAEDITNSEFGGAGISNNKMNGLYFLTLTNPDNNKKYESGVYVDFNWTDKATWEYVSEKQMYIAELKEGETKIAPEKREEFRKAFEAIPQEPVPATPVVNETPTPETPAAETPAVETPATETPAVEEEAPATETETPVAE